MAHADHWSDVRHYSWSELLRTLEHDAPTVWEGREQSHGADYGDGWARGVDYSGMLALVSGREPWEAGRERIETLAREQAGKHLLKRPFYDLTYDVTGQDFDVAAVLEGRPECWLRPEATGTGDAGLVRIVVDMATSGGVHASTIETRMVAVAACALTLEATGAPVEVLAVDGASYGGAASYLNEVQVNNAGEPIDVSRIVALAHPATYRRGFLRLIELTPSPAVARAFAGSYGTVNPMSRETIDDVWGTRAVYLPPCHLDAQLAPTVETLLALVKRRMGVAIEGASADDYEGE